ncbi:MAG: DUF4189 domain-containing protein [Pseudomonadota bacterium]
MIRAAVILAFMSVPAHAESFLSLAMDAGAGVHAFSKGNTVTEAQSGAMESCGALAGDCKIISTRQNICMSLAFDYSNGGFGVWTAETADVAQREAVPHCASYGNPNCQTVETVCAQ